MRYFSLKVGDEDVMKDSSDDKKGGNMSGDFSHLLKNEVPNEVVRASEASH